MMKIALVLGPRVAAAGEPVARSVRWHPAHLPDGTDAGCAAAGEALAQAK